ncbi:MAG: MMPL family transporter [Pseudomonadota bacterium]|nr:MMPL family transporter [Pseudomonadota bacterium]
MLAAHRRGPAAISIAVWLIGLALALVVALRANYVADLSAFLPSAPTPEQAVLLDQLKSGAGSRLILVGIEGGDATARATASKRLAAALRRSGRFASVDNGDSEPWQSGGRFVFEHRYALSPAVDPARFSVDGLRAAIDETLALLGTPAGSLLKPILLRDPTGETVRIADTLTPAHAPKSEQGVWVSRSAERAVLVMTTRADGSDLDAQQAALATVRAEFASIGAGSPPSSGAGAASNPAPAALRLAVSGAGSFGVAARERIKAEVERLAILGSLAMLTLLWMAFGSMRSVAVAALPVATGVLAGIACVSLGFGQVHGMTLGFGTTLIGEAVDYAIYYLVQTRRSASADAAPAAGRWLRDSWPTVRLGLFTSIIGFAALVFAGFPGLAQLGVFSIAGLLGAALTTRFVFPLIAPDGAPGEGLRRRLGHFMQRAALALPRLQLAFGLIAVAAAIALLVLPSAWHGQLTDLSPIGHSELDLDAALRADVGATDAGSLIAVSAVDEAAALAGAEAVGKRLDPLLKGGVLDDYSSPARFLPSPATQRARLASLPDAAELGARLKLATEAGPLPAERLAPFVADVQAARAAPPFDRRALDGTPLAVAVDATLLRGSAGQPWRALLNLQPAEGLQIDTARVREAISGVAGAQLVSIKSELDALYARYVRQAMWQAAFGAAAVVVLLAWALRRTRRLVAVLLPLAAATLIVLALLVASGTPLGILHLVGLLLTVAIGSNYALFFDHLRERPETDPDTLASLLLANLTTVMSFGLLATSKIPVLQAVGIVVAPGALLCLVLSAAFIPGRGAAGTHGKIAAS